MCLPDMSGLDVINSLREGWRQDNFILITSHKSEEVLFAARECGVTLLHKPFPPAELLQVMETSLAGCGRTFCGS
jgi:DNA-binding response OmpR family regulator